MSASYIKKIDDFTWEVKLGAGILPIIITESDITNSYFIGMSTVAIPYGETIESFKNKLNAIAAVRRYKAESRNK